MKAVSLGSLLVVALVIAAVAAGTDRQPGPYPREVPIYFHPTAANADLIAVSASVPDRYQQLTIIDPKQRVMGVYHVEYATGKITLRSVRRFQYDLELTQFNGTDPLPEEIRALLPPR
ncbi:MAG: hypothetical protein ACUVUC_14445 [Thermoguttaceae bacterium]